MPQPKSKPVSRFGDAAVESDAPVSRFGDAPVAASVPGMERIGGQAPGAPPMPSAHVQPVHLSDEPTVAPAKPGTLRAFLQGNPSDVGKRANIPVVSGMAAPIQKAVDAPMRAERGDYSGAAADVIKGAGAALLPAAVPAILAAPGRAALSAAMGMAGGAAGETGARALGASEGQAELAGVLTGGAAGHFGPKAIGAGATRLSKPVAKSALNLPGKSERHGATPAEAVLEETTGFRPSKIQESAIQRINELKKELEALAIAAGKAGNKTDFSTARKVIADAIAEEQKANGIPDDLMKMQTQLLDPRRGFAGTTQYPQGANTPITLTTGASGQPLPLIRGANPSKVITAEQDPLQAIRMKHQFGDDFTRFDANIPLKDSARKLGNRAYHEMAEATNASVPGAQPLNQRMQSLIPASEAAQRMAERAGPVQRVVDRATRPTGGMAAPLAGAMAGGPVGAAAVLAAQEAVSSPALRMAVARGLYGTGKAASAPMSPLVTSALGALSAGLLTPSQPRRRPFQPPIVEPQQ